MAATAAKKPSAAIVPTMRRGRFHLAPPPLPRDGGRNFGFVVPRLPPGRRGSRSSSVGPAAIPLSLSPSPGGSRNRARQDDVRAADGRGIESGPQLEDGLLRQVGRCAERATAERGGALVDQRRGHREVEALGE